MSSERDLIIAALTGEASEEERRALAAWRAESPENEELYRSFVETWELTGAAEDPRVVPPRPAAADIVRAAARRESANDASTVIPLRPSRQRRRTLGLRWVAVAAGLVALGVGLGQLRPSVEAPVAVGAKDFVTGAGALATITLEDGTVVRLGPDTRLTLDSGGDARQVYLEGRAYFAVAASPMRPFKVLTPGGDATVLGTRFDAEGGADGLQVTVVEGEVEVSSGAARVRAQASERVRAAGSGVVVEPLGNVYEQLEWLGPFIAFESTPLTRVADEFRGRFGLDIRIEDSVLESRTVTGWFTDQSPEEMVTGICRVVGASCTVGENLVRMRAGGQAAVSGSRASAANTEQ